jgi:hypothetical protein
MAEIDDLLNMVAGAKTSEGGNHFRPGTYLVTVKKLLGQPNRKLIPHGIGEFEVEQVLAPGVNLAKQPVPPHTVGEAVSNAINLTKDMGPGNFKAMILACIGETDPRYPDGSPQQAEWRKQFNAKASMVVGKDGALGPQLARGVVVKAEVFAIETKGSKQEFNRINWSPGPADLNTPELIQARRAKFDGTKTTQAA